MPKMNQYVFPIGFQKFLDVVFQNIYVDVQYIL